MPDDRLFHLALGHSQKVNSLTDFERGVWLVYKLASDDFGVMRYSATPLQDLALWLERRPTKNVLKALDAVRDARLIQTFEHQGQLYAYQWDWQTWQKITHPRQTKQPKPPIATLDQNTEWLFRHHPTGGKLTSWQHPDLKPAKTGKTPGKDREDTGSPPGVDPKDTGPVLVGVGSDRDRVGGRSTPIGASLKSHQKHAVCGIVCVPSDAWDSMLRKLGGDEAKLTAWVSGVLAEWQRRVDAGEVVPEGDDFAFWRARWTESHGTKASQDRRVESADETAKLLAERRSWVS